MKRFSLIAVAITMAYAVPAQAADTLTINGTPADGWHYGAGNDYTPANTRLLTTDAGDELALRFHQTGQVAPAAVGDTYSFALGTQPISFDWGFDTLGSMTGITGLLTIARIGGTSVSYDPFFFINDNHAQNGSTQNSARLNWFLPDFDAGVDSTYQTTLTINGLTEGTKTLSAFAKIGNGATIAAVPEPATWAMMLIGFGLIGFTMRRRQEHYAPNYRAA